MVMCGGWGLNELKIVEGYKDCPCCEELREELEHVKSLFSEPCPKHMNNDAFVALDAKGCFLCTLEDYKNGRVIMSLNGGKPKKMEKPSE